ncbi:MAG: glycosyltransferase family 4 protein [Verrucomicrobiales bacterium]|nr:glycosyltransferase family 4 protein [Verrucomicrobiales bacterium]
MKLGLIYHQLIPAGGMEKYLMDFAIRLHEAGHELTYLTSRAAPEMAEKLPGRIVMVPRPLGATFRLWHFNRQATRLGPRLGVDRTLGFGPTLVQDAQRAGGGCRAEYAELLPFWKRWRMKTIYDLRLEKQLYTGDATRWFVTNSDQVSLQLQRRYHAAPEKFRTIHTAVDSELFQPSADRRVDRERICRDMHTDPNAKILLFVSLSHSRKGLDALLEALRHAPEAVLWIVGKPLNRGYVDRIDALGLRSRVRVVAVTNSVVKLYQTADWFVHPTLYDACANTVLQSMASGLPGLISAKDGSIDHVQEGVNGRILADPKNAEELGELLHWAVNLDEDSRVAMGQAARQSMLGLTWERHVAQWEKMLAE